MKKLRDLRRSLAAIDARQAEYEDRLYAQAEYQASRTLFSCNGAPPSWAVQFRAQPVTYSHVDGRVEMTAACGCIFAYVPPAESVRGGGICGGTLWLCHAGCRG